ncbi:MAG: preprotein translocase subunit YajC [Planctomycetota bacterium]|nr:preprotein translocase subunit YajC [Planctomycetota bacterium]
MADTTESVPTAIAQGQTTAVAGDGQTLQVEPVEGAGDDAAQQPQAGIWNNWLLYAAVAMWVWWLLTRKKRTAQREAEKKAAERKNTLVKGDRLVTIGRMHGAVVAFTDDTVTIKPDNKSDFTMTFDRQAIYRILPRPGEEEENADGGAAKK